VAICPLPPLSIPSNIVGLHGMQVSQITFVYHHSQITKIFDFSCCSRRQTPIHVAWAKKIHSYEGQHTGPTPVCQLDNTVMRIILHLGDRKDETNNPALNYTTLTQILTLGEAGRNDTIPMKFLDSDFYL
jgi:hypothetical protein